MHTDRCDGGKRQAAGGGRWAVTRTHCTTRTARIIIITPLDASFERAFESARGRARSTSAIDGTRDRSIDPIDRRRVDADPPRGRFCLVAIGRWWREIFLRGNPRGFWREGVARRSIGWLLGGCVRACVVDDDDDDDNVARARVGWERYARIAPRASRIVARVACVSVFVDFSKRKSNDTRDENHRHSLTRRRRRDDARRDRGFDIRIATRGIIRGC